MRVTDSVTGLVDHYDSPTRGGTCVASMKALLPAATAHPHRVLDDFNRRTPSTVSARRRRGAVPLRLGAQSFEESPRPLTTIALRKGYGLYKVFYPKLPMEAVRPHSELIVRTVQQWTVSSATG